MIILYHIMKHINRKEIKYEKEKFTVDLHATGRYVGTRPLRMQFVRFYQIEKYLDEQGANVCHVHFASKTASHALIFEFNSTKDMEEQINKSETLKGIIKDLQKSDLVNGNCCIVSISPEALKIFRDTKG